MANFNPYRMVNSFPGTNPYGTNSPDGFHPLSSMYQKMQYNPQNFYQMQMEKQFKDHMEFMNGNQFKFDSNGKLLLKPFQCSKCLKLFDFENALLSHFEDCQQFACKHFECRNSFYTAFYVANENFESYGELENHVKEKHVQFMLKELNDKDLDYLEGKPRTNLLVDFEEEIQDKILVENNVIKDKVETKENTEKYILEKNEKLEKENIQLKMNNDKLTEENKCLKEKLSIKNDNVQTLLDNFQTILTNFSKEEFELSDNNDKEEIENKESRRNIEVKKTFTKPLSTRQINFESQSDTLNNLSLYTKSESSFPNGTKRKSYSCENCEESFLFKNDLLKHSKVHKVENNVIKCDRCKKSFPTEDLLKDHENRHHIEGQYSCKFCNNTFKNKWSLKTHNESDHTVNTFKCENCDAKFNNENDIRKHKQAHENKSFCHTFNNFPKCQYGSTCTFLHLKAPFCAYDGRCSRPSCQYRHRYGCLEKNRFFGNNFMKRKVDKIEVKNNDAKVKYPQDKNED